MLELRFVLTWWPVKDNDGDRYGFLRAMEFTDEKEAQNFADYLVELGRARYVAVHTSFGRKLLEPPIDKFTHRLHSV